MFLHWCLHVWVQYDYLDLSSLSRSFFLLWVFWRVWWLCATCLPGLLCWCVSRERLLVLEARILGLLGWRKAEGEGLCGPLGWCQRGKGDYSSFSATELGMRLGEWGGTEGTKWEVWISLHPTCCSRRRGHCPCKGWGLGWHTECGDKGMRGRSVGSTKDENRGRGDCHMCSAAELSMRLGDWFSENKGRKENLQARYLVFWQANYYTFRGDFWEWYKMYFI